MLARLSMLLDAESMDHRKSSALQGVLMERLDTSYAAYLHKKKMHPYSQYLSNTEKGTVWHIQTLNAEAYREIIEAFMAGPNAFELHHGGKTISILNSTVECLAKQDLLQDFYQERAERTFFLDFLSPTAFRQNGRYMILPDVRLLCQNLMMKYSAASESIDLMDEEALAQIVECSFFTKHKIHSMMFPLEGTAIPGFMGRVGLRCQGTETMARYLRLLLTFGEFSGIGVKTAMGMGAMRLRRDRK